MVATTYLTLALAAPLAIHGLVFKAVSKCYYSPPPEGGSGYKRAALASYAQSYTEVVDWADKEKRQEAVGCDTPGLVGFADDGTQLTFNGGVQEPALTFQKGYGNCYATNGDYQGAAFGVDSSPGHYSGGLINFQSCEGISKGVSYNGCSARLNGQDGGESQKTNCNDCKGDGFFTSCTCCAVFF